MASSVIISIYVALALIAAISLVGSGWAIQRFLSLREERYFLTMLVWTLGVGSTVLVAALRPLDPIASGASILYATESVTTSVASLWAKRILTAGLIGVSVVEILRRARGRSFSLVPGSVLYVFYMLFFLLSTVTSSFLGSEPAFLPQLFYVPVLLTAVFLQPAVDPQSFARNVKAVLLVVLFGTSIVAAAAPDFAFFRAGSSFLPGVDSRLAGLTAHPNSLGPLALLYLILEAYFPSRKPMRYLGIAAALAAIVLSQSKTTWIAATVIACVSLAVLLTKHVSIAPARDPGPSAGLVAGTIGVMLFASGVAIAFVGMDLPSLLTGRWQETFHSLSTFMGRNVIWDISVSLWEKNPLFGYGPTLWSPEFRIAHSMPFAGQAHNQFVQTLGDSGVVGVLGLSAYLIVLLWFAVRYAFSTRGLSLALVLLPFSRTVTETPFRSLGVVDSTFFMHFVVFTLLLLYARQRGSARDGPPAHRRPWRYMP